MQKFENAFWGTFLENFYQKIAISFKLRECQKGNSLSGDMSMSKNLFIFLIDYFIYTETKNYLKIREKLKPAEKKNVKWKRKLYTDTQTYNRCLKNFVVTDVDVCYFGKETSPKSNWKLLMLRRDHPHKIFETS